MKMTFGFLAICCLAVSCMADSFDLSGEWKVRLDPQDVGETEQWFRTVEGTSIQLPGIVSEAGLGEPLELEPALTKEVFHFLHQKFRYIGAAWYTKEIDCSKHWDNATLLLERSIWETSVWANGQKVGSQE